jgi:hypothetical protein
MQLKKKTRFRYEACLLTQKEKRRNRGQNKGSRATKSRIRISDTGHENVLNFRTNKSQYKFKLTKPRSIIRKEEETN